MTCGIEDRAKARGITRLCHFTPSRNLAHILAEGDGIVPTKRLKSEVREMYTPTDIQRLDGHTGHICCSIEYPNGWYMDRARQQELLFKDWVIILVDPSLLWAKNTLFCPRNAAANYGSLLGPGLAKFDSMYASRVAGAYGQTRVRGPCHLNCSPTDDQAEVLVSGEIGLDRIIGIAVATGEQALTESIRLEVCGVETKKLRWIVAPDLFNKAVLSGAIRAGRRPEEQVWQR